MPSAPPLPPPPAAENLNVLDFWSIYSDAPNALYKSFADEALAHLAERKDEVAQLQTAADWQRYRDRARQNIVEIVGPFPEKTPLNPRVVGVVNKGSFRIEKVVYESQPNLHVTAALFVPQPLPEKAPGILYCSGHHDGGFSAPNYKAYLANLVRQGFVVLAFDPIGQGERLQYFEPQTGRSEFGRGSSTREHMRAGSQCFLTGSSLARHMIWDGVRSLDYLLSRPEVDAARIGVNGRSGGGTQTAYIAAIDDRVHAAAPENYLTTFEKLLKSGAPQDAEQNFLGGIARGFDQPDLLLARAPKPALLVATTRDIFSIAGTQEAYAQLSRACAALGHATNAAITIDDAEHASTPQNRRATYAFLRQHLGLDGDIVPEANIPLTDEELRVTDTGQVATSLRGETVFSLNRRLADALVARLDERRRNPGAFLPQVKRDAARLSGHATPISRDEEPVFSGRYRRNGYAIDKYLLPVDERYAVPVLAFVPDSPVTRVVLHLDPEGKAAHAAPGGEIESWVNQGCLVISPDVRGFGELGPGNIPEGATETRVWYGFVMLGKSTIGRQIEDVMRVVRFAERRFGVAPGELAALARGRLGPLLLHTAAIEDVFAQVALVDAPLSYRSIAATERYDLSSTPAFVPAVLTAYDLPDLAAALAPRKLLLVDPREGSGKAASDTDVAIDTAPIERAYATQTPANFSVVRRETDVSATLLARWLQ